MTVWLAHEFGLRFLPEGIDAGVLPGPEGPIPGDLRDVEFWVPPFLSSGRIIEMAGQMPHLRVVQLLSAGADHWVGRLREGVALCDARGVHDSSTAEWVVAAVLASLRRFDFFARAQVEGRWTYAEATPTDELAGKHVLIVGAGSIGTALAKRLAPFEVTMSHVARTARHGVHAMADLPRLLPEADIVVLLVPLTAETRGLVDAGFLAALKDGALLVNAARGPVADTAALTKELSHGRVFAALDVTDPEPLPPEHPLWRMPNVLITPHVGGTVRGLLGRAYQHIGAQVRRYLVGEPLLNEVRDGY